MLWVDRLLASQRFSAAAVAAVGKGSLVLVTGHAVTAAATAAATAYVAAAAGGEDHVIGVKLDLFDFGGGIAKLFVFRMHAVSS